MNCLVTLNLSVVAITLIIASFVLIYLVIRFKRKGQINMKVQISIMILLLIGVLIAMAAEIKGRGWLQFLFDFLF